MVNDKRKHGIHAVGRKCTSRALLIRNKTTNGACRLERRAGSRLRAFLQELYPHKCSVTRIYSFKKCCNVGRSLPVSDSSKPKVRLTVC